MCAGNVAAPRFDAFAQSWLAERVVTPRTRDNYDRSLRVRLLPTFGALSLNDISEDAVRDWFASPSAGPAATRNLAYSLLRLTMQSALAEGLIDTSPCQIDHVTTSRRVAPVPASRDEVEAIAKAMPPPYQALVLMAAWLGMRFSELTELRRGDIDVDTKLVRVRRAVEVKRGGIIAVTTPKSNRGHQGHPDSAGPAAHAQHTSSRPRPNRPTGVVVPLSSRSCPPCVADGAVPDVPQGTRGGRTTGPTDSRPAAVPVL